MAREILFRGKRTDNGECIEGTLYQISTNLPPFIMLVDSNAESHEVIPETVGQFTGLTDKNGKRIFEGDIVKRAGDKCIVRWIEKDAKFIIIGGMTKLDFSLFFAEHLEVIGNIHDNPELLNGKES